MQHAEKMDLPELSVMVARGLAKTGFQDQAIASKMARDYSTSRYFCTSKCHQGCGWYAILFLLAEYG